MDKTNKQTNQESYTRKYSWLLPIRKLQEPRVTGSAFFQLKLGHGYIKSYLARLGKCTNDLCQLCGRRENPEHLLLSCKALSAERQELKDRLRVPLSIQILLHTRKGIKETLVFLQQTQIATRKWHLERHREEEEEEEDEAEEEEEVEEDHRVGENEGVE